MKAPGSNFDFPEVSKAELPFVSLLMTLLSQLGAGDRDYIANLEYIHAHTGGISAFATLNIQVNNPDVLR